MVKKTPHLRGLWGTTLWTGLYERRKLEAHGVLKKRTGGICSPRLWCES